MGRKRSEPDTPAGCPAWLATYGDMITLVLTFFVLLYSMSTVDVEKWKALVMNLGGNPYIFDTPMFDSNDGATGALVAPELDVEDIIEESEDWFKAEVVEKLEDIINELNKQQAQGGEEGGEQGNFQLQYNYGDPFVILRVQGDILFATAEADLMEEAIPYIRTITEMAIEQINIGTVDHVNIEGHADIRTLSPSSPYKNNEILSIFRAYNTWLYVVENYILDEGRVIEDYFNYAGWGTRRPINQENNEEAWRQNRRVDFYIYKNMEFDPAA